MSRFANLEFGVPETSEGRPMEGEPIRDKHFFHDRAMAAWLGGDFETALENFSRSLEDDSTFYDGWFWQVRMLNELREYSEAILWAGKALEMFPACHELLAAKAVAFVRQGDLRGAQRLSDEAVALESSTWSVWIARAEILLASRNRIAEVCIQNALSLAGNDGAIARLEAGRTLARARRFAAALPPLQYAVRELSGSALAWYEFGLCQRALRFQEAAATLEQCLVLRPDWREARLAATRAKRRGLISWFCGR